MSEPVSISVIWEPRDQPDLRLIRALDALLVAAVVQEPRMTDEEVDMALDYMVRRRAAQTPSR